MSAMVFEATAPDGTIFRRTTKRGKPYVAAVLVKPSYPNALKVAGQKAKVFGSNWEFACQMVAWGGIYGGERMPYTTDEQIAKSMAFYKPKADEYGSAAEAIEGEVKKAIAAVEEKKAAGSYDKWLLSGFAGRADLAAKLCQKEQGNPWVAEAVIAPAVQTK